MKYFIVFFVFVICCELVKSDLTDCVEMCGVGAVSDQQRLNCIRECHRVVTCGGEKKSNVNECISHCRKKVRSAFLKDCEKGCQYIFSYRQTLKRYGGGFGGSGSNEINV